MSIISVDFLILLLAAAVLFYLVPKGYQWMVLLAASIAFYGVLGIVPSLFVLGTATVIWAAAVIFSKLPKKDGRRKIVFWTAVCLNIGVLAMFKYFPLPAGLVMPLGISFYTFQSIGYLTDVYHGTVDPERNYFRSLLFVCFFPQMTQGPISDYKQLAPQLFGEHSFTYENFSRGIQRMLWGYIKKLMLADRLQPFVRTVFTHYNEMPGMTVLIGAFAYSIQLYADFSGYMDIVCGLCDILDIRLTENFRQPYFATSVADYWRRWHISLGNWFKKYVYYPTAASRPAQKLGRGLRKVDRRLAGNVVATFALLVTWAATGIWHGNTAGYIVWGLLNGAFLIMSVWLEPAYEKTRQTLHIREGAWYWRIFTVVRTFTIVTLIKVLPEVGTLRDGLGLWRRIFTFSRPAGLGELLAANYGVTFPKVSLLVMMMLFVCSLIAEKTDVRGLFAKLPWLLRILILAGAFVVLVAVGIPENMAEGGFAYARF